MKNQIKLLKQKSRISKPNAEPQAGAIPELELELLTEGKAQIMAYKGEKVSKDLPVFYNKNMEGNRTISVKLLNAIENKG
ncbi:hypothetical protein KY311_03390, partial [Candidatus Woesearchaeota archaeon]|nr:hypothetical protein [Candidatus Woesearchaeota archaeon]